MPTSARQLLRARQSGDRTQLHPRRRGGLNIRPEPGASTASPVYNAPGFGRAMRAPTTGAVGAAVRTGGYAIRPYGPAPGFRVGPASVNCPKGKRSRPGPSRSITRPQAAQNAQLPHRSCAFRKGLALNETAPQTVEKPRRRLLEQSSGECVQGVKTPCAFNQYGFSNFFKSLKIRPAWRKDFFDTLRGWLLMRQPQGLSALPGFLSARA